MAAKPVERRPSNHDAIDHPARRGCRAARGSRSGVLIRYESRGLVLAGPRRVGRGGLRAGRDPQGLDHRELSARPGNQPGGRRGDPAAPRPHPTRSTASISRPSACDLREALGPEPARRRRCLNPNPVAANCVSFSTGPSAPPGRVRRSQACWPPRSSRSPCCRRAPDLAPRPPGPPDPPGPPSAPARPLASPRTGEPSASPPPPIPTEDNHRPES